MALKPLRPCRHAGCAALTRDGYCPAHRHEAKAHKSSADWHWFYTTPIWTRELRPGQLLREPFCRECAAVGQRTRAVAVDHVVPHRGRWSLFVDRDNLQSLCKRHHDAKTARELAEAQQER